MKCIFFTLSPEFFHGFLSEGIIKKALNEKRFSVEIINFRDYSLDKHKAVDDSPYGGGGGMLIKPEAIIRAFESIELQPRRSLIMTSPAGKVFKQQDAQRLAGMEQIIFICGRYEGIDERIYDILEPEVFSIGDYVLSNGELAALVMFNAAVRLIDGVLGNSESLREESFEQNRLEYPHYTRPESYRGYDVPRILLEGHHKKINMWRNSAANAKTQRVRPDLLK